MVQMKVKTILFLDELGPMLYIPHGSDERRCLRFKKADVLKLYIPHGSDERYCRYFSYASSFEALYPTWFR